MLGHFILSLISHLKGQSAEGTILSPPFWICDDRELFYTEGTYLAFHWPSGVLSSSVHPLPVNQAGMLTQDYQVLLTLGRSSGQDMREAKVSMIGSLPALLVTKRIW